MQPRIDASGFVFIDETWTKTNMTPLYGWSPVGERCVSCVPHGHWLTQTFVAGLTPLGLIAPYVFDGPINGESFIAYVEQMLVPELSKHNTVILDNLGSHKSEAVRKAIRATGARLFFLPPLQPRPQPDRTGLCQNQASAAQSQATHHHGRLANHRTAPQCLLTRRMPKLLHQCWMEPTKLITL